MDTTADGLFRNFLTWEKGLRDGMERGLVVALSDLQEDAQANHPYTDRSGDLTASIHAFVETPTEEQISGILQATARYAAAVEKSKRSGDKYAYLWPAILRAQAKILSTVAGGIHK